MRIAHVTGFALLLALGVGTSGCGKKGRLVYPDQLLAKPPQLELLQRGNTLELAVLLPSTDMNGKSLTDLTVIAIARRVYQQKDAVRCSDPYLPLAKVELAAPAAPAEKRGNVLVWTDSDVRQSERYQYRVHTVQKGATPGVPVESRPVTVLEPPTAPTVQVRTIFGGYLQVTPQGGMSPLGSVSGYMIYRSEAGAPAMVVGQSKLGEPFIDRQAMRGIPYGYQARTLVTIQNGERLESALGLATVASVEDEPTP